MHVLDTNYNDKKGSFYQFMVVHKSWPYVLTSRVTSLSRLYLRKPLVPNQARYGIAESLVRMIQKFQYRIPEKVDASIYKL